MAGSVVKNPTTERFCIEIAIKYKDSPVEANRLFKQWVADSPDIKRWEVIAIQRRIHDLIK